MTRAALARIEVHAAHACNLTCESCSHFSNSGHAGVVRLKTLRQWLTPWAPRLAPARMRILGGEPTLNPELPQIVRLARELFPDAQRLEVVTNGFFLERHPGLAAAIAECRATIHVSIHHDSPRYQEHLQRVTGLLDEWGRQYGVRHTVQDSFSGWTRRHRGFGPGVLPFADGNPAGSWSNCPARFCRQIFDGKLWKCSPIAYLRLQKRAFPQLAADWDPYLRYEPLDPGCTDEELTEFLGRREEPCCGMCPVKPPGFEKPDPLIPRSVLLKQAESSGGQEPEGIPGSPARPIEHPAHPAAESAPVVRWEPGYADAPAGSRIAVMTLYTPHIRECGELAVTNKAGYCARHGYDFIACDHSLDPTRPPSWSKIRLLQAHLHKYGWVFWSDADSLIMNWGRRIESLIADAEDDLVIGSDINGACAGQFIIRNSPASHAFLKCVYEQRQCIRHKWWEQAAIHELMRRGATGIRYRILPHTDLNSYPQSFRWGDFVLHAAGPIDKLGVLRVFARLSVDPDECPEPPGWRAALPVGTIGPSRLRPRVRRPSERRAPT